MRWQHPDRGLVVPANSSRSRRRTARSCRSAAGSCAKRASERWRGRPRGVIGPGLFVCVNVSAREIQQPGFVGGVEEALAWAGLEPSRLILEITETALIKATSLTVSTLESLRALGVRVVIDDFGTGYFSLSHLRQFPVDALKIASEFIQVADDDSRSAALAGAIVALGDSLDIATVAEGIESKEQAERMRSLGCTYGQGYFFAKPMTSAEIEAGVEGLASPMRWEPEGGRAAPRRRRNLRSVPGGQTSAA